MLVMGIHESIIFWCGRKEEAPPNYDVWFLDVDKQSFMSGHIHPKKKLKSNDRSNEELPDLIPIHVQREIKDDTLTINP
eukprot:4478709-Ditylum_brightwellii.AAC.1